MNTIIDNENIHIDTKTQDYLIKISNNSIRNIINNLEKIYLLSIKSKRSNTIHV